MSQMFQRNRGLAIFVAMLAGFLIGIFSTLYMISNWVPGELIYREATPLSLARRGVTGDYRDFYMTYVANRYAALAPSNQREALNMARNMLGVNTGDASTAQAAEMAATTLQVASSENDKEALPVKDAGWFSRADETNLGKLAQELTLTKNENVTIINAPGEGLLSAKGLARVLSLLPILLALIAAGLFLMWLTQTTAPGATILGSALAPDANDPSLEPGVGTPQYQPNPPAGAAGLGLPRSQATASSTTYPAQKPVRFDDLPLTVSAPIVAPGLNNVDGLSQPATIHRSNFADLTATNDDSAATQPFVQDGFPATTPTQLFTSVPQSFPAIEYTHADEHFDQDYDITGSKGLLIGTCGANVAERAGMVQPTGANALMISVFDKAAFKTTSKVLILPELRSDQVLSRKLKEKGELVDAHDGEDVIIDTQTLRVSCKVSNLDVANDGEHGRGYFRNVRLTFTAQQRA